MKNNNSAIINLPLLLYVKINTGMIVEQWPGP